MRNSILNTHSFAFYYLSLSLSCFIFIFQSLHGFTEGYDMQDLVLLQTFLGLSIALGVVFSGSSINKTLEISFKKIRISRQYVCQVGTPEGNACKSKILIFASLIHLPIILGLCYTNLPFAVGPLGRDRLSWSMLLGLGIRSRARWLPVHAENAGHRTDPGQVLLQVVGIYQECWITAGAIRSSVVCFPKRLIASVRSSRVLHLCSECSHLGDYPVFRRPSGRKEYEVLGQWVSVLGIYRMRNKFGWVNFSCLDNLFKAR